MPDWHYKGTVQRSSEIRSRGLFGDASIAGASSTSIAESTRLSYEDMDTFDIPASFETESEQTGMGTFSICTSAVRHNGRFYDRVVC